VRAEERRTPEQILEHYLVEKELATRLKDGSRSDRAKLYAAVYEELFSRVPHHPQLHRKLSPPEQARRVQNQLKLLSPWITRDTTFLEIGAGDCSLSFAVAPSVTFAYGVDVSETVTRSASTPPNFELLLSNGSNIPVASGRITLAYSNQLMEHLHPDDALDQLREIYRALASGGTYICVTPSRLTGPHDISRYFDDVATGFHLKEYTSCELIDIFMRAGFRTAQQCFVTRRGPVLMPNALTSMCEGVFAAMPHRVRTRSWRGTPLAKLLELRIAATK
jgi:SAM-dependent methyltransferase